MVSKLGRASLYVLLGASTLSANISGVVYKDFNNNGSNDGGDAPVIGVPLTAVCEDGNTYHATTDTNGAYTLTGFPSGSKCRVEADTSTAGVDSGMNASGSSPLVDRVTDGSTHDISTGSAATYCQANPDVIMAALPGYYTRGKYSIGGGEKPGDNFGTVFKVPAPSTGTFNNNNTIDSKRTTLATFGQTGAIWGSAWKKGSKSLFVSAALKRYVPLKDESSTASVQISAGTIYKIDTTTNPATVSSFVAIPNVLSSAAVTEFANRDYGYDKDTNIIKYTGRMGLGDLEISEDESKLYVINMNTKELVVLDATTGNILESKAIPNPYTNGECNAEKVRPWALKVRGNDVFLGSVCEDKIEDDIGSVIQKYDGTNFVTIAKTNSLRYLRPRGYKPSDRADGDGYRYRNWTSDYADAAMLTDIEFTNKGDLVLGYNSRATYNRSGSLRGDIRKMCINSNGTYTDESSDIVQTNCLSHVKQYENNPTNYYEFYIGDYFGGDYGGDGHPETAAGALAQAPGAPNIIVGMIDATDWYQPGAIGNFDNITGDKIGAQAVINNNSMDNGGEREAYGSKAGGMGDVELLCDPAPIEVGNYVWVDVNGDGIQDPNEPGMPNVPVKLTCNNTLIGTATTDANGHYYFGGLGNVNLTAGNTITFGQNCVLSIAQADVNDKSPTITNPNGNADDIRDNDAVANGTNNEIIFTTTNTNNHNLDFGIAPTIGCLSGTLFLDNNNNGTLDGTDTTAPVGITVKVTDSFGIVHTAVTDANGVYMFSNVPAGNVKVVVDTTDTDIPEGAVFGTSTANTTVNEGVAPNCVTAPFPYTLPAPTDQDPKDVAMCANPTSLTWEGSTKSTKTVWQGMKTSPLNNIQTSGGSEVHVTMTLNDSDGKFYDTDTANSSGSGTSAAFGEPYLTLYLGNQENPGDGQWDSAGACATHGYELEAGQKSELVVEFDQEVVLDNWRIRDVDSGDDRGGVANWEWQDGIKVEGFDENNNPVAIETKIGSAGAGLIKDENGIVHTDKDTYNAGGGDFATGAGTVPNGTNGHIVLTSDFVPVKKIVITHLAGPDMPCQTRSALAMAGLAVCKPLHISGTVFDDPDGDDPRNGECVSSPDGAQLYMQLTDESGKIIAVDTLDCNDAENQSNTGVVDYYFDEHIYPNKQYKLVLTTENKQVGEPVSAPLLPQEWKNVGEIDPADVATPTLENDKTNADGTIAVNIATASIDDIDFGIDKRPTAGSYQKAIALNPGGDTQVRIVPDSMCGNMAALITDHEEGEPSQIRVTQLPGTGKLYYQGNLVTVGQIILNGDPCDFTVDPGEGDTITTFTYVSIDQAGLESDPGILAAPFSVPNISGILYLDTNNNGNTDGDPTSKSCDANTPLYINLVSKTDNKVIASNELDPEDGSYVFYNPDVQPKSSYELILSQIQGKAGENAPEAGLPKGCMFTGENKGENPNNPEGTNANGKILIDINGISIDELNFGIAPSVKIGDKVWIEDDNDGNPITGTITYPPVGTVVTATAVDGSTVYKGTTDANGKYTIELPANTSYLVKVAQPTGTVPTLGSTDSSISDETSENNKPHNNRGTTVTVAATDNFSVDFGFFKQVPAATITGNVSKDTNNDDTGDKDISGVTIKLFADINGDGKPDGVALSSTTTDANGNFNFTNLPAGDYVVVEIQPNGMSNVSENEGGLDNDKPDNKLPNAIAVTLDAGETDTNNDFVEEQYLGAITGNVSKKDSYGKLKPIVNVTLVLFDTKGNEVARTKTNEKGNYRFDVSPGKYYIQESQPNGYYDVSENEGGADNESTNRLLNTINVVVGTGETDVNNDFVESTELEKGCDCAPSPVIPCSLSTQGTTTDNLKDHSTELHWIDSYYEAVYHIYVNGEFIATVDKDVTTYTLTNLQSATSYIVVIEADNGYGKTVKQTIKFKTTDSLGWLPAVYYNTLF